MVALQVFQLLLYVGFCFHIHRGGGVVQNQYGRVLKQGAGQGNTLLLACLLYTSGTGCEMRHYRLRNYIHRNAENYPTHELGPIAKILGINSGNRMLTLTSMASKAVGMHAYAAERNPENKSLVNTRFAQGDVVNTIIKCAGGETILLTLNTTLPRFYSRDFTVCGTCLLYTSVLPFVH